MKWLTFRTNRFAFAGLLLALSYKARFGRAVKWIALRTNRPAFAGLRHSGANDARGDQSNKNNTRHRCLLLVALTVQYYACDPRTNSSLRFIFASA